MPLGEQFRAAGLLWHGLPAGRELIAFQQEPLDLHLQRLPRRSDGKCGEKILLAALARDDAGKISAQRLADIMRRLRGREQVPAAPLADVGDVIAGFLGHGGQLGAGKVHELAKQRPVGGHRHHSRCFFLF
ncbi:hypothetical protein SDC9_70487 [bioreactor metagenome]|uniref:Uncharacterized protein n=1 Tax=bioreactor metagenome TaxID=1076179 RepID=A0A644Y6D6_9ZZZZ